MKYFFSVRAFVTADCLLHVISERIRRLDAASAGGLPPHFTNLKNGALRPVFIQLCPLGCSPRLAHVATVVFIEHSIKYYSSSPLCTYAWIAGTLTSLFGTPVLSRAFRLAKISNSLPSYVRSGDVPLAICVTWSLKRLRLDLP